MGYLVEKGRREELYNSSANPQGSRQQPVDNQRGRARYSDVHMQVAEWLHAMCIRFNRCAEKLTQANMQRWANELRLAEEVDGIDLHLATDALKWAFLEDPFWRDIIASPSGLRRNWPKLAAKYWEHHRVLSHH